MVNGSASQVHDKIGLVFASLSVALIYIIFACQCWLLQTVLSSLPHSMYIESLLVALLAPVQAAGRMY